VKLRLVPRTPERLREEPRGVPDAIHLRAYGSNIGTRYLVEARQQGRSLGDRTFATLADAQAFAKMEAGWHAAKLVDETLG
jgi:hypothetical protein